jgi:N-sulfoglucosamine sulfohydrolase
MTTPRRIVRLFTLLVALVAAAPLAAAAPNIVVFLSDDHTLRDCSVYGSPDIATPNMDRLAAEGMVFERAYVASPSCAPSRAALLTGLYPARNGAEANHSRPGQDLKKLPAYFQELGYQVVSFGKVGHYKQTPEYGFDIARHFGYHEDVAIPNAVEWLRQRKSTKPLCLFVGTNWPHVPWPEIAEGADLESLVVPPTHVDNPTTRAWRSRYVAAIKAMDDELGLVYDTARELLGDDTFFLHTSDHGAQWPFAKWNLYLDGIHTPLIVSWPGRVQPGTRTEAMVSWIDILPTLVEVAGGQTPEQIDGRSFLPVLRGEVDRHRDAIFTTHSGDGNKNVYPTRSVVTADGWHYIQNLHPEFLFTSHVTSHPADSGYWQSWLESSKTDPAARLRVEAYQRRPAEELYEVNHDPWELTNVASKPEQRERLAALRAHLEAWMSDTGDTRTVFGEPTLILDGSIEDAATAE